MITIFIDQAAQDVLDTIGASFPEAPQKEDITVEFIQLALTGVVNYEESGDSDITVYERDEAMSRTRAVYHGHADTANMELNVDKGDFDTVAVVAAVSDFLNNYFLKEGLVEKYKSLDEDSGILVKAEGNNLVTSIVSDRQRPDLMCRMLNYEKKMYRPYLDEAFERFQNEEE